MKRDMKPGDLVRARNDFGRPLNLYVVTPDNRPYDGNVPLYPNVVALVIMVEKPEPKIEGLSAVEEMATVIQGDADTVYVMFTSGGIVRFGKRYDYFFEKL